MILIGFRVICTGWRSTALMFWFDEEQQRWEKLQHQPCLYPSWVFAHRWPSFGCVTDINNSSNQLVHVLSASILVQSFQLFLCFLVHDERHMVFVGLESNFKSTVLMYKLMGDLRLQGSKIVFCNDFCFRRFNDIYKFCCDYRKGYPWKCDLQLWDSVTWSA